VAWQNILTDVNNDDKSFGGGGLVGAVQPSPDKEREIIVSL
jgi:hypothetical protein